MIIIASDVGCAGIADLIRRRPGHPEVELDSLDYADAIMPFNGPRDQTFLLGVEIKKLDDVLQCIQTGRFAGRQLIGLQKMDVAVLLIEGIWRMCKESGVLEVPRGGKWVAYRQGGRSWMWRDLNRWGAMMGIGGGMMLMRTQNREETVQTLIDLHELGAMPWSKHKSLRVVDQSGTEKLRYRPRQDGKLVLRLKEPSLEERLGIQLPGVGIERAESVGVLVRKLLSAATEEDWRQALGMKRGSKTAHQIVEEISRGAGG